MENLISEKTKKESRMKYNLDLKRAHRKGEKEVRIGT